MIKTFTKPFFIYNSEGCKSLTILRNGMQCTTDILDDNYIECDTDNELMDKLNELGFTIPSGWDFDYPMRISMTFKDWTSLVTDVPDIATMITLFRDSLIDRNDRKYIYLSELYPEHEYLFSNYTSFLKENR